ncbi:Transmembrane and coiled-coil domain-containing protein 5B [Sciurus carolinensis]|uniref:Transmembrane and coiled-coil domain-containing protein 5B n=1 Tax=Sciurus carolinensis TaxID=30640 RepID=A0AA41SVK6_SCICA|nr:Transmembrane and coiled-coil domain-containing protein 5B [Sciurus carolinensis]
MEIPNLEVIKQNLDYLNSDLERDLQRLDEANQVLLRKIQEKEETIQSLERDITLSIGQAKEWEEFNQIISEREDTLRDLELETAKLEKNNKVLSRNVMELQKKVKLQKSAESCAQQEKEMVKIESDYQSVYQLCKDQAHYIKKYQEILKKMEKEEEMLLLEKEMHFRGLVFMVMIFIRLLGYVFFHLQYINPDLLVDALPLMMSRSSLKRLRDILFPFLTLEVDEVLPH